VATVEALALLVFWDVIKKQNKVVQRQLKALTIINEHCDYTKISDEDRQWLRTEVGHIPSKEDLV
jgi:hypothetical protein